MNKKLIKKERNESMKCECCYKEFESDTKSIICPECWEKKGKYGFVKCTCPECWQKFYKSVKATKTNCCPDCQAYITKIKTTERKRKQREREQNMSR